MKPLEPDAQAVLDFWFGPVDDPGHLTSRPPWFRKDAGFDAQIAGRFGGTIEAALGGEFNHWRATPLGSLALLLVLDQFTRNVFRGQARSFAGDTVALSIAQALVGSGQDLVLTGVQRQFVYLPFEHAEDSAMQAQSMRLFAALEIDHPQLKGLLDWAQRHAAIVSRFGRFPHRNPVLGRLSTDEENAFLMEPGSSF
jgi:uncharacterized protein (DUF924 family)